MKSDTEKLNETHQTHFFPIFPITTFPPKEIPNYSRWHKCVKQNAIKVGYVAELILQCSFLYSSIVIIGALPCKWFSINVIVTVIKCSVIQYFPLKLEWGRSIW